MARTFWPEGGSLLILGFLEGCQEDRVAGDDVGPELGAVEILGDADGEFFKAQ